MNTCHGCHQPLEPLAQVRTYHSGCDPQGRVEMLERLLGECLSDYSHPRFTDRYGMADRIRAALEYRPVQMRSWRRANGSGKD
jgi:hypothetical protein